MAQNQNPDRMSATLAGITLAIVVALAVQVWVSEAPACDGYGRRARSTFKCTVERVLADG